MSTRKAIVKVAVLLAIAPIQPNAASAQPSDQYLPSDIKQMSDSYVPPRIVDGYPDTSFDTTTIHRPTARSENLSIESDLASGLNAINLSTPDLWTVIQSSDQTALVGLKLPGMSRGVWKDRVLLRDSNLAEAIENVTRVLGVTILDVNEQLPIVTVRLEDISALTLLRSLPDIDYIELGQLRLKIDDSGCDLNDWGNLSPTLEEMRVAGNALRDVVSWNYQNHRIPQAWARKPGSAGEGITVGSIDTGVFADQPQLQQQIFSSGLGGKDRTVTHISLLGGGTWGSCSHGTRMAATIAAPYDGLSIVGVAWRSNLITIRALGNPLSEWDGGTTLTAIQMAADMGANIISMGFGQATWSNAMADIIRYNYYSRNVLFVAAAGTAICPGFFGASIAFPARMEEVIAVTARSTVGDIHPQACGGPEADLSVVIGDPGRDGMAASAGKGEQVVTMGGSSNAAAVVSGIAALVWAHYPGASRDFVRDRLYASTRQGYKDDRWGWGNVNAYAAVGGLTDVSILGPSRIAPGSSYRLTALPRGDGPFQYHWSPGGLTAPSIEAVAGTLGSRQTWTVEVNNGIDTAVSRSITVTAEEERFDPCKFDLWHMRPHCPR